MIEEGGEEGEKGRRGGRDEEASGRTKKETRNR